MGSDAGEEAVAVAGETHEPQPRADPGAVAAAVSPNTTAAIDAATAMPLSDGSHMVESTPSARARTVDGTAPPGSPGLRIS